MRAGKSESCLCEKCERLHRFDKARWILADALTEELDASEQGPAEDEEPTAGGDFPREEGSLLEASGSMMGSVALQPHARALLRELADVLRQSDAKELCRMLLRGAHSDTNPDIPPTTCLHGECAQCGFARIWKHGLRPLLVGPQAAQPVGSFWSEEVVWSRFEKITVPNPTTKKRGARASSRRGAEDEEWRASSNAATKLVLVPVTGTVVEFLDDLERTLKPLVPHKFLVRWQKDAARDFDRHARPSMLYVNIDFAENYDIRPYKEVQSQHWGSRQCTLFINITAHLSKDAWNQTEGVLAAGDEVTVRGELAEHPVNPGSFWAKVEGPVTTLHGQQSKTVYKVVDASDTVYCVPRSELRLRWWRKRAFVGVTDDMKHDSLLMQNFFNQALDKLQADGTVASNGIRSLHVHSDNAAQHFKSAKSMNWLTRQLHHRDWVKSATWDFGAPGHGKGPWDGIGATMKNTLRRAPAAEADPGAASHTRTESHGLATPQDCYEQLRFEFSKERQLDQKSRKIGAFDILWADRNDIPRGDSNFDVEYDTITDVTKHYQFFVRRHNAVLKRPYSCWCTACVRAVAAGPGVDSVLRRQYNRMYMRHRVAGCRHEARPDLCAWSAHECHCTAKSGRLVDDRDDEIVQHGVELAKRLEPGMWVLVETAPPDELWLAKVAGPVPAPETVTKNTRVPVQFLERIPADMDEVDEPSERLMFAYDPQAQVDQLCVSEIRHAGWDVAHRVRDHTSARKVKRQRGRSASTPDVQPEQQMEGTYRLDPKKELLAATWCR